MNEESVFCAIMIVYVFEFFLAKFKFYCRIFAGKNHSRRKCKRISVDAVIKDASCEKNSIAKNTSTNPLSCVGNRFIDFHLYV